MTNPDDYFFNVFNVIDSCSPSFIRARNLFEKKKERKVKTKESVLRVVRIDPFLGIH